MSCPYHFGKAPAAGGGEAGGAQIDAKYGPHMELGKRFEALLPNCAQLVTTVDECRERVGREGKGHCLEESKSWMACFREKGARLRAISMKCGEKSHADLQKSYMICCQEGGEREKCSGPLEAFVLCAEEIAGEAV